MTLSTRRLVQIAAWGGVIVSSTGFFLQQKYIDRYREQDYYKSALKKLRCHAGAIYYLGEPIKDRRFKITDTANNSANNSKARFAVPVSGPKDRGTYYFWAEHDDEEWKITKAELELKSHSDKRNCSMSMFIGKPVEKYFYHNTLLCLVRALVGHKITVDLRNDTCVCGHLDNVDGFMNLSFSKLVYCDPQGNEYFFENLFLQGRNIRYVHIPENKNIISTIKNELGGNRRPVVDKKNIKDSRKVKKAYKQHYDTVASLAVQKPK